MGIAAGPVSTDHIVHKPDPPMRRFRPSDPLPALLTTSFVGVLGMGVVLRWILAGFPGTNFTGLRSAHEHLAWYGLLVPLAWRGFEATGLPLPSLALRWTYTAAVFASILGFLHSGYNFVSIAGSTVVLAIWMHWALPGLRFFFQSDWRSLPAVAVLASAFAIPLVAVWTGQGDPRASELVRSFLTFLLLGVGAPAALVRAKVRALRGWVSAGLVLGAGMAVGPFPHPAFDCLLFLCGLFFAGLPLFSPVSPAEKTVWALGGLGIATLALGILPNTPIISLAGLHFFALGPLLVRLAWPTAWAAYRTPYLLLVALFAISIAGPAVLPNFPWTTLSLALGVGVAATWAIPALPPFSRAKSETT
jgi:hypothetical protein